MSVTWIVLIAQAIICAFMCKEIARRKGYASSYALWGLFLGIVGLLFVMGLPKRTIDEIAPQSMKVCPDCAESIKAEATVCRFCGKRFDIKQIVSTLIDNLNSENLMVRIHALDTLKTIDDSSIIIPLLNFVENMDINDNMYNDDRDDYLTTLNKALQILINHGTPEIAGKLAAIAMATKNHYKHNALIEALALMEEPEVIPALVEAINNRDTFMLVEEALIQFGEIAFPALENKAKSGNTREKKIAESILLKINEKVVVI